MREGLLKINSFKELEERMEQFPEGSLFVFDVDNVLTASGDPMFQVPTLLRHRALIAPLVATLSARELDILYTLAVLRTEQIVIEEFLFSFLKGIAAGGHRSIGLTALSGGHLGGVELATWRYNQLERLGINFSASFPSFMSATFDHLPLYLISKPQYSQGILFSGGGPNDKGMVLRTFLESADHRPSAIIFIDDMPENLSSVERMACDMALPCLTVHYCGAHYMPPQQTDGEETLKQWRHFADEARSLAVALP